MLYRNPFSNIVAPLIPRRVGGESGGATGEQTGDDRRRPADVLVCRAQDIRTGNGGAGVELRSR